MPALVPLMIEMEAIAEGQGWDNSSIVFVLGGAIDDCWVNTMAVNLTGARPTDFVLALVEARPEVFADALGVMVGDGGLDVFPMRPWA